MQILLLPFVISITPLISLFFILIYLNKKQKISLALKVLLGLAFITIGIGATFLAMTESINGMAEKGIKCATGAVVFIPMGFFINVVGIPMLLLFFKPKTGRVYQ